MNIREIKALVQLMQGSDIRVLEVAEGDSRIRLEKGGCDTAAPGPVPVTLPDEASEPPFKPVDFNAVKEITSPMVGVFYQSSAPEAPPFVAAGTRVHKGQVLCIIEAMKLMNEITADTEGEIVDICAQDGQVVEYGQILYKIY